MNKRGDTTTMLLNAFYLLIFGITVIGILTFVDSSTSNDRIKRMYFAEDLGMLITQLKGLDYNLELEYDFNPCMSVEINDKEIIVKDEEGGISKMDIVSDQYSKEFNYNTQLLTSKVVFLKNSNGISVKSVEACKK